MRRELGSLSPVTSLKQLIWNESAGYVLPVCHIIDYPSLPVPVLLHRHFHGMQDMADLVLTASYGDMRNGSSTLISVWITRSISLIWLCTDTGPFEMEEYPETVFRNVPIKIWNAENRRWLTVRYTHPNLEEPFLINL